MTISEVAERLDVSYATAWRWVNDGAFPNAYRMNPLSEQSPWRIPEDDVKSFEERRRGRQVDEPQVNGH